MHMKYPDKNTFPKTIYMKNLVVTGGCAGEAKRDICLIKNKKKKTPTVLQNDPNLCHKVALATLNITY